PFWFRSSPAPEAPKGRAGIARSALLNNRRIVSVRRRWENTAGPKLVLPRRHTDRAIEADHFAVEHLVLDDVQSKCTVLGRLAQTRREWHLLAERNLRLLW